MPSHFYPKTIAMQPSSAYPHANLPSLKAFFFAIVSVLVVWIPVLLLHLTLVLFSALIIYALTRGMANWLRHRIGVQASGFFKSLTLKQRAEWLGLLSLILLATLGFYIFGDWVADKASVDVFNKLMTQILDVFDQLHELLPAAISQHLPISVSSLKFTLLNALKSHAPQLQLVGIHTIRGMGYVLAGAVIGAIAAIQLPATPESHTKPLTQHLRHKFEELLSGFSDVFFAQVKISAINTVLTSVYLLGIMPAIGHPLPMAWTVVLITFCAGLVPVVGNLISNIIIVVLSLTHGLTVSIMSLLWLVGIHKLEYFLNAQIIGHKIRAAAWELLIFMLLLESLFGIAGLISAPIIYAQIKRILVQRGWV